jgi:hypothetical protein
LALLIVGWAVAGIFLYFLSTFLPAAVLAVIVLAAYAVLKLDTVSRKNKSLASLLCWITGVLTLFCAVAMHFIHSREDVLARLIFAGLCLMATLIVLDRRADDWL